MNKYDALWIWIKENYFDADMEKLYLIVTADGRIMQDNPYRGS